MTRNMDLVRRILIIQENADRKQSFDSLRRDGFSDEQIGFHAYLMGREGLLATAESQGDGDAYPSADILHITWSGYEFLEAARELAIWNAAKRKIAAAGVGCTVQVFKRVLLEISKQTLGIPTA